MSNQESTLKSIVHLKENEGRTWAEIGKILKLTRSAVRKRYYRYKAKHKNASSDEDVSIEEEINCINLSAKTSRKPILENFIRECEIDLNEWEVVNHIINRWEVGAVIDGSFQISPLYQIKAKLLRKNPIEIIPFVRPLNISSNIRDTPCKIINDSKSALILPDIHLGFSTTQGERLIPFHDRRCLELALALAEMGYFDYIIINGDGLDLPDFSDYFIRKPTYRNTTQAAVIEMTIFIARLRERAPHAEIIYLEGNHEERIQRMLLKYFSAAYGLRPGDETGLEPLFSLPRLLSLHKSDVLFIDGYPNEEYWLNDIIQVIHGNIYRNASGGTASTMIQNANHSICFAHVHRQELASRTIFAKNCNRNIYVFSPGCMCRIDGVVPAKKERVNWQQGVGIIHFNDHDILDAQILSIQEGRLFFEGSIIESNIKLYNEEMDDLINEGLKELDK